VGGSPVGYVMYLEAVDLAFPACIWRTTLSSCTFRTFRPDPATPQQIKFLHKIEAVPLRG
jgi:hypothetical protein